MSSSLVEGRERALLDRMTEIAEAARGLPDPRVRHLVAWIREKCCPAGKWLTPPVDDRSAVRRVLVFTELGDTKRYLDEQLRTLLARTDRADERIATFHGGMDEEGREDIKRRFNAALDVDPLRILVATDAAREGVNLQNHCADLFHFDVPWNPSRMEQRNGRIDRKGQRAKEVRCHYFVFTQRPEDRVLATLVKKTRNIQDELGSLSQVLEAHLGRAMEGGIRRREADRLVQAIEAGALDTGNRATVDEELDQATRARRQVLEVQMNGLRDMMATAKETFQSTRPPSQLRTEPGATATGRQVAPTRPGPCPRGVSCGLCGPRDPCLYGGIRRRVT